MRFSDLLGSHKEVLEEGKKDYEVADKMAKEQGKIKLTLIFTGIAFLVYGLVFFSRWVNPLPISEYGGSPLTGMATAPITENRVSEIKTIGILGLTVLIGGIFTLGIGITMPSETSLKKLFKFK